MTERMLKTIGERYPLKPVDAGEFAALKMNGMKFTVRAYDAAGLGRVSVLLAHGMFGLMRMDTLIINPAQRDLPLFSYDRVYAMGNDTLILELYGTTASPFSCAELDRLYEESRALPERERRGACWYDGIRLPQSLSKKGRRAMTPAFDRITEKYLEAWLDAGFPEPFDMDEKRRKTEAYVGGLLKNGGPSTDVFRKNLGDERTAALFRNVLFGTA